MQGFKSFPDPTYIEFHPGVTAIVGPNGSGKSNITDAIRWVLGEQGTRVLRVPKMEDIIFTGTETRRRMGYAEVAITFDNNDRVLPIDYDMVEVKRRYYRSGESEYLINQTKVRLKDIVQLLADTGIGRDGYSIIGQGKVETILSGRSDDRRKVFEEAAGIVKYKMRKTEAERKLDRTEQNLIRLEDILSELELRLKPLKRQARRAEQFLELQKAYRGLDISLTLLRIEDIGKEQTSLREALKLLAQDKSDAEKTSGENRKLYDDSEDRIDELEREVEQLRLKQTDIMGSQMEYREKQASAREQIRQLTLNIEREKEEIQTAEFRLEQFRKDLSGRIEKKEILQKQLAEKSAEKEKVEAVWNGILSELSRSETAGEELKLRMEKLREEDLAKQAEMNRFAAQREMLDSLIEQHRAESEQTTEAISEAESALAEIRREEAANREQYKEVVEQSKRADRDVEEQRERLRDIDERIQSAQATLSNDQYRLQTLKQLESDREGFHRAVRSIMGHIAKHPDEGKGMHGPLAELLTVPEKYQRAIEVTLGAAQHNLVTDDRKTAAKWIEWLKENRSGRETFLPIDVIRGRKLAESEFDFAVTPHYGIAAAYVECHPRYQEIVNRLLGRTLIAENLDDATALAEELNQRIRIVTLDGDVVNPGGSMTGGRDRHDSSGLLRRRTEIDGLEEEIASLESALDDLKDEQNSATDAFMRCGEVKRDLEERNRRIDKLLYETALQKEHREKTLRDLTAGKETHTREIERATATLAENREKEKAVSDRLEAIRDESEQLRTKLADISLGEKKKFEERDALRESLSDLSVSVRSLEELLHSEHELDRSIDRQIEELEADIERLRRSETTNEQDLKNAYATEKACEENILSNESDLKDYNFDIKNAEDERRRLNEERQKLFTRMRETDETLTGLQIEIERAEQKVIRCDQQINDEKNRLWETYQLSFPEAQAERVELIPLAEKKQQAADLKRRLQAIGSVDPESIKEYKEVSERFTFLNEQRDDILASKNDLDKVIRDLNTAMTDQFTEKFNTINRYFGDVFAELFGGGHAELVLADDDDVLNCNIDIKAQPPGKRLQSLDPLSGGERALTAIALLFAIFKLSPAPFCVLDEVEATLDDPNILRFTDYIRHYTDESQFILVTHRKGTMEAAEQLYGVTMKEKGVSKILSLALTDADQADMPV